VLLTILGAYTSRTITCHSRSPTQFEIFRGDRAGFARIGELRWREAQSVVVDRLSITGIVISSRIKLGFSNEYSCSALLGELLGGRIQGFSLGFKLSFMRCIHCDWVLKVAPGTKILM